MARVLLTGGTGTLGRRLRPRLEAAGHDVRILSRRPGPAVAQGDLVTGAGLDDAARDIDVIAHCATSPFRRTRRTDVDGTQRLLDAAGDSRPHVVYVSIVGVDRIPFPYYQAKLATEELVGRSGLPHTILRATQFHELLADLFGRLPILPALRGVTLQPLDADECAARLAELVAGAPAGRVADIGGPHVRTMRDLARLYKDAWGSHRPVVGVPIAGKAARAFKAGHNVCPDNAYGKVTWEQWLMERFGS